MSRLVLRLGRSRRPRRLLAVALGALLLPAVVACGSDNGNSSAGPSSSGGKTAASAGTLTVAIPVSIASFAHPYIAQSLGLFKKYGVNVKLLDNTGSNTLSYVQSHRADIAAFGTALPLIGAKNGLNTQIILDNPAVGPFPVLVARPSTTPATLKSTGSCRVAVLAPGSSVYGMGVVYNQQLGTKCDLVPLATAQAQLAAVQGGSVQAAVVAPTTAATSDAAGQTRTIATAQIPYYTSSVYFGDGTSMSAKKTAVVGFLRAMLAAQHAIETDSADKLASLLHQQSAFSAIPMAGLVTQTKVLKNSEDLTTGLISSDRWNYTLKQINTWKVPNFSPSDQVFGYGKRVDMSYLTSAQGAGS